MLPKKLKVLLVEDHPIVLSGCRQLFSDDADISLLEVSTIAEARLEIEKDRPQIAIVDVGLPDGSGLDFARELVSKKIKTVIFSTSDTPALAIEAIDLGAKGFVSKADTSNSLIRAVDAVNRGETWLSDNMLQQVAYRRVIPEKVAWDLTDDEKSILKLLIRGLHLSEIAAELDLSYKTVRSHCAVLQRKLSARTLPQMLAIAARSPLNL